MMLRRVGPQRFMSVALTVHARRRCTSASGGARGGSGSEEKSLQTSRFGTKHTEIIKSTQDTDIVRLKLMPLMLVEEVPLPQKVYTDLELLMMSWSQEQALKYFYVLLLIRVVLAIGFAVAFYIFYRSRVAFGRKVRGVDKMPPDMKVGSVVYLDFEYGSKSGRVLIGLLNEQCPLYCEAFHRRCTASGGSGESFRGLKLTAMIPRTAAIFGEGRSMTHDVAGFNEHYLPTEYQSPGPFRGALSSIPYTFDQQSLNFAIHLSSGDTQPQIFGIILGGYNVIEQMSWAGVAHQCRPLKEFVVVNCGELCTLDKSMIVPMPWEVYESVSHGYDPERWGPVADLQTLVAKENAVATTSATAVQGGRPWWKLW